MNIWTLVVNDFEVNAYVIASANGDTLLIDPSVSNSAEENALLNLTKENHLNIKCSINTHLHLDHVLGNYFVEKTWNIKTRAHKADEMFLKMQKTQAEMFRLPLQHEAPLLEIPLVDNEEIQIGENFSCKVIHVPGHSPGCVALYFEKENAVFTGDILFKGAHGRTDLIGGSEPTLLKGIREKLLTLPPHTKVYPGHGPHTTIAEEKFWY